MTRRIERIRAVFFLLCCIAAPASGQAPTPTPGEVVVKVVAAAEALLRELSEDQRHRLLFSFDDEQQRRRWSNLPAANFPRGGLRMGDLAEGQREAVLRLLRSTLSERGFQQVLDNMNGGEVLRARRGRRTLGRDEFYISLLGEPSVSMPWMWQFGGHHLGINATIVGDRITLSPSLTGGQPVDYTLDGRHVRQLAGEEDKAFALVSALSGDQLRKAVVGKRPVNLAYGPGAGRIHPRQEGIRATELDPGQQALLLSLIEERVGLLNEVHTQMAMEKIAKELASTFFAWFGPTSAGSAASFRIQGPSIIIEYAPQPMGGDATDHIHAIYRDPSNDYGAAFEIPASADRTPE